MKQTIFITQPTPVSDPSIINNLHINYEKTSPPLTHPLTCIIDFAVPAAAHDRLHVLAVTPKTGLVRVLAGATTNPVVHHQLLVVLDQGLVVVLETLRATHSATHLDALGRAIAPRGPGRPAANWKEEWEGKIIVIVKLVFFGSV